MNGYNLEDIGLRDDEQHADVRPVVFNADELPVERQLEDINDVEAVAAAAEEDLEVEHPLIIEQKSRARYAFLTQSPSILNGENPHAVRDNLALNLTPIPEGFKSNFRSLREYLDYFYPILVAEEISRIPKEKVNSFRFLFRIDENLPLPVMDDRFRLVKIQTLVSSCLYEHPEMQFKNYLLLLHNPHPEVLTRSKVSGFSSKELRELVFGYVSHRKIIETIASRDEAVSTFGLDYPFKEQSEFTGEVYHVEYNVVLFRPCNSLLNLNRGKLLYLRKVFHLSPVSRLVKSLCDACLPDDSLDDPNDTPFFNNIVHPAENILATNRTNVGLCLPKVNLNNGQQNFNNSALNISQENLFKILLLLGPPGTGKTATIAAFIANYLLSRILSNNFWSKTESGRILICTASNGALDELAKRLLTLFPYISSATKSQIRMVRIGVYSSVDDQIKPYHIDKLLKRNPDSDMSRAEREQSILTNAHIVLSTLDSVLSGQMKIFKRKYWFQYTVVDEASQILETQLIQALHLRTRALILVGDHYQLQPTVFSQTVAHLFGRSPFERFFLHFADLGLGEQLLVLNEQYRMHEDICRYPSQEFYRGALIPAVGLDIGNNHLLNQMKKVIIFDIAGREEVYDSSKHNFDEVNLVVRLLSKLQQLLPQCQGKLSVGVISFYRSQTFHIQSKLDKLEEAQIAQEQLRLTGVEAHDIEGGDLKRFFNIKTANIDGFQGQERDIIIMSTVRSLSNHRGPEPNLQWLGSRRRLNVGMTRARSMYIIVTNKQTILRVPIWARMLNQAPNVYTIDGNTNSDDLSRMLSIPEIQV